MRSWNRFKVHGIRTNYAFGAGRDNRCARVVILRGFHFPPGTKSRAPCAEVQRRWKKRNRRNGMPFELIHAISHDDHWTFKLAVERSSISSHKELSRDPCRFCVAATFDVMKLTPTIDNCHEINSTCHILYCNIIYMPYNRFCF